MVVAALFLVLAFLGSWLAGWILAEPTNNFLDATNLRDPLYEKLDAYPGSETFFARLLECRVCTGSYFGALIAVLGFIALLVDTDLSVVECFVLAPIIWVGSIVSHYFFNLVSASLKAYIAHGRHSSKS